VRPEHHHVLAMDEDIEDSAGEETYRNLEVSFFSAAAA
jgi:hypothetical protein